MDDRRFAEHCGAQDKAVEIDHATGAIRFGDGVHGAIPASGTQISVSYQVEREGFLDISAAIKETTRQINEAEGTDYEANVYSSYETQSFITKMNDLGANALYDGMTIHPYSGTPQGSSDEAWYDDAMLKAENTGIARVQSYVNMLPEGKVPVISEYGIFRSTDTQVRSMTHALYIAKVMMEYVRLAVRISRSTASWITTAAERMRSVRRSRRSSRQWRRKALTPRQEKATSHSS